MHKTSKEEALKALDIVDSFLKSMRINGYFGNSPHKQTDLDKQQEMIDKKREIQNFIEFK